MGRATMEAGQVGMGREGGYMANKTSYPLLITSKTFYTHIHPLPIKFIHILICQMDHIPLIQLKDIEREIPFRHTYFPLT